MAPNAVAIFAKKILKLSTYFTYNIMFIKIYKFIYRNLKKSFYIYNMESVFIYLLFSN